MFAIEVWSGSNGCARKRTVTDEPNRCSYSLPDKEIQKAIYRLRADLPAAFKWKLIHPGRTASRWRFECEKWKAKSELGSKKKRELSRRRRIYLAGACEWVGLRPVACGLPSISIRLSASAPLIPLILLNKYDKYLPMNFPFRNAVRRVRRIKSIYIMNLYIRIIRIELRRYGQLFNGFHIWLASTLFVFLQLPCRLRARTQNGSRVAPRWLFWMIPSMAKR